MSEILASNLTQISSAITLGVCLGLVTAVFKIFKQLKKNKPIPIKLEIATKEKLLEHLIEIKTLANAERVQLHLFHNGDHFINGSDILKFSCILETTKRGVKAVSEVFSQRLVSNFLCGISKIVTDTGHLIRLDIDKDTDGMYKAIATTNNTKFQIGYRVVDISDKDESPIGFIVLDFREKLKENTKCVLIDGGDDECESCKYCAIKNIVLQIENILAEN